MFDNRRFMQDIQRYPRRFLEAWLGNDIRQWDRTLGQYVVTENPSLFPEGTLPLDISGPYKDGCLHRAPTYNDRLNRYFARRKRCSTLEDDCTWCPEKTHSFEMNLALAMAIGCGFVSRNEWRSYVIGSLDVSHRCNNLQCVQSRPHRCGDPDGQQQSQEIVDYRTLASSMKQCFRRGLCEDPDKEGVYSNRTSNRILTTTWLDHNKDSLWGRKKKKRKRGDDNADDSSLICLNMLVFEFPPQL
ncbi:uncharacterized protein IWZ02DRAFT_488525 [Phyllosticta citriasiana]|uniref:uncharacterized protein n=1 Tax=Phyllosticta citriasiana TaxID=595635 RepID=UPI0030FD5D47